MRTSRSASVIVLLALLAAAPAFAEVPDCGSDCIAILFAPGYDSWCAEATPYAPVTAHLVLIDPSFTAIEGIGFRFVIDGPLLVLGVTFGGPVICDTWEPLAYCHAWSPPLPVGPGATVLAELVFYYGASGAPALIGLANWGGPEDDRPWAWLGDDVWVPLNPLAGAGEPLAQVGGECGVVRRAPATWSRLKSLYR